MHGMVLGHGFRFRRIGSPLPILGLCLGLFGWGHTAAAQPAAVSPTPPPGLQFQVSKAGERLEMMVNTSRILTMEKRIPRLYVCDPNVIQATPIAQNQIQVSAIKPGVTQLNLWDEAGGVFNVDVVVIRNAADLIDVLKTEFPDVTLHVRPLKDDSVYIRGLVSDPNMLVEILHVAKGYYPNVINGLTVGGVQQVALHVKVMEVSRSKLKQLGLDWEVLTSQFGVTQGAAGILAGAGAGANLAGSGAGDTVRLAKLSGGTTVTAYLQALRQYDLAKLLAEPTLTTMSGRAASFNSGGSFPVIVPSGLGTNSIQFREYGTRIDFIPTVLGNGTIRLEVRPSVSEINQATGVEVNGIKVPGLTERFADTSVELRAGQTLALAGLIQSRIESQNKGVPLLADLPWVGRAFSRIEERANEVELLILVTPEIVGALDPHQVPQCGPGQNTTLPRDSEFYGYGYLEVPNCRPATADRGGTQGVRAMVLPSGPTTPPAAMQDTRAMPQRPPLLPASRIQGLPAQPESKQPSIEGPGPNLNGPQSASDRGSSEPMLMGPLGYDPMQ